MSKNELKEQRLTKKIDERAKKDAQFLWKTLKGCFYLDPKDNMSIVRSLTINVCFCEKSQDFFKYAPNRVFIAHGAATKCLLLSTKKIRYPKETCVFIQQMAEDEGFTICSQGYSDKFHFDNFLEYNMGPIYGEWIAFTS